MNRLNKIVDILFVFSFLFLSGCAVGPDFERPKAPADVAYTSDKKVKDIPGQHFKPNQPVSATWWVNFHSPQLNNLMQEGIKQSYTLASMQETLMHAREMVNAATGGLYPQAALQGGVGSEKYGAATFGGAPFTIAPFTYYAIGPGVSLNPDIFGGTRRTIEQQKAMADYQEQELNAAFLTLTGNITTTALTVATLNAQVDNVNTIIEEDKKNLALVQKAYELGSGTKVQVLSAAGQLANDETLLPTLYQQVTVAKNQLNILLGEVPSHWQPPALELDDFVLPHELPLSIPSELIHARPDILASEALLHSACASVGIATANLYPQINLSASTSQQSLTTGGLFDASSNAYSLLAGLTAPIFTGGTLTAERRAAVHAYNAAYANYKQVVVNAFVQVNNVLNALKNDEMEVVQQKKALTTSLESLKLSRLSYDAGNADLLDILYTERLYTQAILGYQKALAQRFQDTTQLYLALGGGIRP